MIYGIGIDLVKIKRIAEAHQRWGERFHHKAFTSGEIQYCLRKRDPAPSLAARFAAKEALVKALGIGLRRGVHLRDVEVQRGSLGKPVLKLHGRAEEICAREGITGIFLSLTHDQDFSSAVVVLEKA
ncbi:MAG: holo-[acyl-carrier-protein] synthase [Deltaproteobacteria bacterium]|nr:MAG: holo-[acyl-carrier-protein] synthase [Deltaproteobacteria bacterium]